MSEILVTVYVLALEREFDVFLPIGVSTKEAITIIQNTIKEMSDDNYEISEQPLLYSEETGKLINMNNVVKFSGLKNGCKVLLK